MAERNVRINPIKVFITVGQNGVSEKIREAACNLTVALAMEYELKRHGVQVMVSRYICGAQLLQEEIAACNLFEPDLSVAIQSNADETTGYKVFYQIKNWHNAMVSKKLADCFSQRIKSFFPVGSRGVETSNAFDWLNLVWSPTILCETDFADGQVEQLKTIGKVYAMAVLDVYGITYSACEEQVLRYTAILADDTRLDRSCKAVLLQGLYYVSLQQFAANLGLGVFQEKEQKQVLVYPAECYHVDEFANGLVRRDIFQTREERILAGLAEKELQEELDWCEELG